MLLDPLTALSLAGTIVQFVDFTSKILTKGAEVHRSIDGSLRENVEIESITKDLVWLNSRLMNALPRDDEGPTACKSSNKDLSLDEQALQGLVQGCSEIANELLQNLEKLKVIGDRKRWKSLYKALKSVWNKSAIDELQNRLSRYKEEMELHLLVNIKSQIDVQAFNGAEIFNKLDHSAQLIITYMSENQNSISAQLHMQQKLISRFQEDSLAHMDEQHERTRAQLRETLERLGENGSLFAPAGNSDGLSVLSWQRATPQQINEMQLVRNSLWNSTLDDRFDDITEAHKKTFGWIYRNPESSTRSWSNFDEFLRKGQGAYWINGKPGSGKSTLLKFLYKDKRTEDALKEWSGVNVSEVPGCEYETEAEVITAAFFFWNSGNRRQMTEDSMLRSLLFRVMRRREELIPIVLEEYLTQGIYRSIRNGTFHWSLPKLRQVFVKLLEQQTLNVKFLFLIDGLDEFEGDLERLSNWLLEMTSPSVKMVLSSRPWNVFRDAFEDLPQLRLQDLTHPDITQYVEDNLNDNKQMKRLADSSLDQTESLVLELVSKASGVFLWVRIVVGSLLDGLRNHDRISDLQARLKLLPDDLEALYRHILSRADAIYSLRRARYLLMRQAYDAPPLTLAFSLSDEEDPELCIKTAIKAMTKGEALDRCEEVERRLQASCAGLLEVDYQQDVRLTERERHKPLQNHDYYRTIFGSRIQFMHRTVKDFFADKTRVVEMCSLTDGTGWNPHVSLLQGWIMVLEMLPVHLMGEGTMRAHGHGSVEALEQEAKRFAQMAEAETGLSQKKLLRELHETVNRLTALSKQPRQRFIALYGEYRVTAPPAHGAKVESTITQDTLEVITPEKGGTRLSNPKEVVPGVITSISSPKHEHGRSPSRLSQQMRMEEVPKRPRMHWLCIRIT